MEIDNKHSKEVRRWHGVIKTDKERGFGSGRGSEQASPRCATFGMWIILSWRQLRLCAVKINFYLSLKQFKLWALPIIRVVIRNNFLWLIYVAGQTSNSWTSALLIIPLIIVLSSEAPSTLSHSLAQNVILNSFYLSVSEPLVCGIPMCMYVIKFGYFLLLICHMLI